MTATGVDAGRAGFRHSAAFYSGLDGLLDAVVPFVREGLDAGEPVLVAEVPEHLEALRCALDGDADRVAYLDIAAIGANPARIIPAWRAFVADHGDRPVRGVGEPAWVGRRPVELEECRLHEALLNVAFDDAADFSLLCPYDRDGLPAEVLAGAQRTHPFVEGATYGGHDDAATQFSAALAPAPAGAVEEGFDLERLSGLRRRVRDLALAAGLGDEATDEVVLAVHELACNSVEHAGGSGVLRSWSDPCSLVMEVSDGGTITDLLVGREQAMSLSDCGRGVWLANQLCDLVQLRSSAAGTTVRLHSWL
ncbi:MAG: sensor histidine kinase [Nocardioidaceae bacterium]|nr:sensor histidine kinase [Nocardioidaceae bacterium]NUS50825.1 sensor histidine kinase [Nocardioidaceae bacterium]